MIHDDELPRFKEVLKTIMKVRNFEELRKDILPYVREVRVGADRRFTESMFSKKFWSTFMNKEENADIKELWESLPFLSGKVSQKKKRASQKIKNVKKTAESSPQATEAETEKEKPQDPEEDFSAIDVQTHDYIDDLNDNEPHYSADKFLFNGGAIFSDTFDSAEDKQTYGNDHPQDDFYQDFWSTWNKRSLANQSDNNDNFSMIGKYGQFAESEESAQRVEWNSFNDNATSSGIDFLQASFSVWK